MLYGLPNASHTQPGGIQPLDLLSTGPWFAGAAGLLIKAVDGQPLFPCHFAVNAVHKSTLFFSGISEPERLESSPLLEDLRQFLSFYRSLPYRSALATFVDTRGSRSLEDDERTFWSVLRYLQRHSLGAVPDNYDAPDWHFAFDDEELYFNGHSPHYASRVSRRSSECLAIVIQTRFNLRQVTGDLPYARAVSDQIRLAVDRYDRIPRSPYLGPHFDWRQFWLLDDNGIDTRTCPLER
jgi:FPC/CPF motif-containing protein YcgG